MDLRDPLKASQHIRPSRKGAWIILIVLATGGCSRNPETRIHIELRDPPVRTSTSAQGPSAKFICPEGDSVAPKEAQTGDHSVLLTWNASTSASPNGPKIGYCLYRRKQRPVDAKTRPAGDTKSVPCTNCERVNITPVEQLGCLDTIVENDTVYYYAATAINESGDISDLSKQTSASVTGHNSPRKSIALDSYHSCREHDAPAQAPTTLGPSNH